MEFRRESIFVSSLRGFFKTLFVMLGLFAAFFLGSIFLSVFSPVYHPVAKTTLQILPDLEENRALAPLNSPVILQINIHGVIGDFANSGPNHVTSTLIHDALLDSRDGFLQNNRVKGILLHFDTPGGSAIDSDNIYRLLMRYKELYNVPIYGYVNGLCASGGMYIASAADRLFCGPAGIVGSVGVRIGPFFNVYDTMTKWGIQSKTITEGIDKDSLNPVRPWKPDEDANIKGIVAVLYQQFVDIVTQARPHLNKTKLIEEYGAKIFDGVRGLEYGYVDGADVSYQAALLALMEAVQIDPRQPYQVVELRPKHSLLEELFSAKSPLLSGKLEHRASLPHQSTERDEQILFLY